MKLALALLLMTTALGSATTALAAAPARNLMPDPEVAGQWAGQAPDSTPTLVDDDDDDDDEVDDDDDDEGEDGWLSSSDDEGDDDDDGDCAAEDDDDDCASATTGNASKVGTTAPPRNGLFTDGTAPVVKSN
jgi:hypothetical protein